VGHGAVRRTAADGSAVVAGDDGTGRDDEVRWGDLDAVDGLSGLDGAVDSWVDSGSGSGGDGGGDGGGGGGD